MGGLSHKNCVCIRMDLSRHPRRLSSGANNTVIVLSETEVGKLFGADTRTSIGDEAEKLKFANKIKAWPRGSSVWIFLRRCNPKCWSWSAFIRLITAPLR